MGRAAVVLAVAACAAAAGCATTIDGTAHAVSPETALHEAAPPAPNAPAPRPPSSASPFPSSDELRLVDPCGLLDEAALEEAGNIAQFGAAVQLSVCSALVDTGDVLTRVELSVSPSTYADTAPDVAAGTCERTFAIPGSPRPASIRVADRAGVDACPLAEKLVGHAEAATAAGPPQRGVDDPVSVDPCEFVDDPAAARPRPYACQTGALVVEYSLRQVGSRAPLDAAAVSAGTCRWTHQVGAEFDVTRDGAPLDDFTIALGRAYPVVTVSAPECAAIDEPAAAVAARFP